MDTSSIELLTETFSSGVSAIISLGWSLLTIASLWKIFEKHGEEGWKAIIPIYNMIILFKIVEMPAWYAALILIPCVGIIVFEIFVIIALIKLAKKMGKEGVGFALLLILFQPIALAILAFSKDNNDNNNNNSNLNQPVQNNGPVQDFNQQVINPNNIMNNQFENTTVLNPINATPQVNNSSVTPVVETTPEENITPVVEEQQPIVEPTMPVVEPVVETAPEENVTPVVEEQQPIVEPTTMPVVEPVVETAPEENITPVVEEQQPIVEPTMPVVEPVVETAPEEQAPVDPIQNIEPPVIPQINDNNE